MQDINFEETESKIIKTQDENGEIHNFELVDIINLDGQDYGLLIHLDDQEETDENKEEEDEVVIMRLSKQDEAYTFETIEDDDEFNKVISYIEAEEEC